MTFLFSVSFVYSDASFLRSGTFVTSKRCSLSARAPSLKKQAIVHCSDDFKAADKATAARALNEALIAGWSGFEIAKVRIPADYGVMPWSARNSRSSG